VTGDSIPLLSDRSTKNTLYEALPFKTSRTNQSCPSVPSSIFPYCSAPDPSTTRDQDFTFFFEIHHLYSYQSAKSFLVPNATSTNIIARSRPKRRYAPNRRHFRVAASSPKINLARHQHSKFPANFFILFFKLQSLAN